MSNIFKKPLINNQMYMHHRFGQVSCQFSVENGYLVTLRYCELSVTEFPFVCLFLYFALVVLWAYAHALKSSFLSLFLLFYSSFYHLLLVGFTHATLPLKFIHVRLVYWTRPPYAVERGRSLFLIHPCESVMCFIYVTDTVYHVFFFPYFPFVYCDFTQRPHSWESEPTHFTCFSCYYFSVDHHLIKLGHCGFDIIPHRVQRLECKVLHHMGLV